MAFSPIADTQTAAKAPIDEELMDTGLRLNLDDHEARLLSLEASSGGGGVATIESLTAELLTDPQFATDVGVDWKQRHHVLQHKIGTKTTEQLNSKFGENLEGNEQDVRFITNPTNDGQSVTLAADAGEDNYFRGYAVTVPKGVTVSFKIKKGENYFGIGAGQVTSVNCDKIDILIDGQTPSSLGLYDDENIAALDSISTNEATTRYQKIFWFYGLDGEEHIVTLENDDSASKVFNFNFVDVGYVSRDFTIDHKLKVNDLRCSVRGVEVSVPETEVEFTESIGHGHAGIVAVKNDGQVRAIDGIESAQTQLKAGETINFSSPVTTLPCKNVNWFPDNGICLISHPNGGHYQFSYGSKTDAPVQTQSLDDIIWQLQPTMDFDVEQGFTFIGSSGGEAKYNMNIIYWAKAPIEVNSGNNKIDFSVVIDGVTTNHTATIANGFYSSDMVSIAPEIIKAMEAAKSLSGINGKYYASWSEVDKKWQLGAKGHRLTDIQFKFNTGASIASSLHPTLGFNNVDLGGLTNYSANTATNHKAQRCLYADRNLKTSLENEVMFSNSAVLETNDVLAAMKFGAMFRTINTAEMNTIDISCDPDACGMIIYLLDKQDNLEYGVHIQIDDYEDLWLRDGDPFGSGTSAYGMTPIRPIVIAFPRGSKKIRIKDQRLTPHSLSGVAASSAISYIGYKNLYARPNIEELDDDEQILSVYNITPKRLFNTDYAHNAGALYSPGNVDPAKDDIDSITESAGWLSAGPGAYWNQYVRYNTTANSYVDIEFTVDEGGGCYGIFHIIVNGGTIQTFLTDGVSINEGTDLISETCVFSHNSAYTMYSKPCGIMGLKAGTYIMRFKSIEPSTSYNIYMAGFSVISGKVPDSENYVKEELSNAGQGLPSPLNYQAEQISFSAMDRMYWAARSLNIVEQRLSKAYTYDQVSAGKQFIRSFSAQLNIENGWNASYLNMNLNGDYPNISTLAKSISIKGMGYIGASGTMTGFFGGTQTPLTTNAIQYVKGGSANGTYANSFTMMSYDFNRTCTMAGLVVTLPDTRGLRIGQRVQLIDNVGATENVYINSIIANTSFTIDSALTSITDTDVANVDFSGHHSVRLRNDTGLGVGFSAYKVEPLPITPSRFRIHNQSQNELEVATTVIVITSGSYFSVPIFSDGTPATFEECSFELIGKDVGSATWDMHDFPLFVCSSGSFRWKITAVRMVDKKIKEQDWSW